MRIAVKTTMIIATSAIAIFIVIAILTNAVLTREFLMLEQVKVQESLESAVGAIVGESQSIGEKAVDWGRWDESYLFIKGENPTFPEDNLNQGALQGLGVDVVAYYRDDGTLASFLIDESFEESVGKEMADRMLSELYWGIPQKNAQGLFFYDGVKLVVGSARVVPSSYAADPSGKVIMMKRIDDRELSEITGQEISLQNIQLLSEQERQELLDKGSIIKHPDRGTVAGIVMLDDVNGKGAFTMRIESERDIYRQKQRTFRYLIIGMMLIVLLNYLITASVIKRDIISRITRMHEQLSHITERDDHTSLLLEEGDDEITSLIEKTNRFISTARSLQQATEQKTAELRELVLELEQVNNITVDSEINAHKTKEEFQAYARKIRHELATLRREIEEVKEKREKEEGR